MTGGYQFRDDADAGKQHVVSVDWRQTDVPRTAVGKDLLYSLGSSLTVCEITRNDGAWRLQRILETGRDPGARVEAVEAIEAGDAGATDSSESTFDLERLGWDQIQAFVAEKFASHGLSDLVAGVLEAEGFSTQVAPPGPDGGIDVFAGQGPLGLDSPRLIVQVKSSPSPVDVKIVRELHGVLSTHGADQALLVAWGGVNKTARQELRGQFFRVRVWDADNLLDAVLRNYDQLSEELRADLPLKRVWSLVEERPSPARAHRGGRDSTARDRCGCSAERAALAGTKRSPASAPSTGGGGRRGGLATHACNSLAMTTTSPGLRRAAVSCPRACSEAPGGAEGSSRRSSGRCGGCFVELIGRSGYGGMVLHRHSGRIGGRSRSPVSGGGGDSPSSSAQCRPYWSGSAPQPQYGTGTLGSSP